MAEKKTKQPFYRSLVKLFSFFEYIDIICKKIKEIAFYDRLYINYYMDMSTVCVVCGTKSQDYTVECYCCGNFYCSDKCKVQDHQKKIFHHHTWMDYRKIYEDIMNIDENIRFVTIFDVNGKIRYSDHRQGIENLLTPEESKKSLRLALDAWRIRGELAPKIGKGKYVLAEYENIKRITMPLGNSHLLYVTTNVKADHSKIISVITNIARQKQDY